MQGEFIFDPVGAALIAVFVCLVASIGLVFVRRPKPPLAIHLASLAVIAFVAGFLFSVADYAGLLAMISPDQTPRLVVSVAVFGTLGVLLLRALRADMRGSVVAVDILAFVSLVPVVLGLERMFSPV